MPSFTAVAKLFEGDNEIAKSDTALAKRFEDYKAALDKSAADSESGATQVMPTEGGIRLTKVDSPVAQINQVLATQQVEKALGTEQIASIQQALAAQPDLNKAISLTSPISTGLVPFDLEAPAKFLVPVETPLRNKLPRKRGMGTSRRYKRITGISNAQTTAGVSPLFPGITDATGTQFNQGSQPTFLRGPQISYSGDDQLAAYQAFSLSDSVYWSAQWAGQGFEDIRQLSQTSVLFSSLLAEERMALYARGASGNGYAGPLASVGTVTGTPSTTGGTIAASTTNHVWVTAYSGFGETVAVDSGAVTTTGSTSSITVFVTPVAGALGYRVYAGTVAGAANAFYVGQVGNAGSSGTPALTITTIPTTGATAPTANSTVATNSVGYDGIMTIVTNPALAGYTANLNAAFGTSNPGGEYQTAFAAMYAQNLANPDEVLLNGSDRKQLSSLLQSTGGTTGLRIQYAGDGNTGHTLGQIVTGITNTVTGKMVDLTVHPYMPQGQSAILTHTLPYPNSEVDSCWTFVNVQDYMGIQWPVLQFTYDFSSYWFGTFLCYAPAWQGSVTGIKAA